MRGHLDGGPADPLTAAVALADTVSSEVSERFPVRTVRVALY